MKIGDEKVFFSVAMGLGTLSAAPLGALSGSEGENDGENANRIRRGPAWAPQATIGPDQNWSGVILLEGGGVSTGIGPVEVHHQSPGPGDCCSKIGKIKLKVI